MTLHWLADQTASLERLRQLLAPSGVLIYAALGPASFAEWRAALADEGLPSGLAAIQPLPGIVAEERLFPDAGALGFLRSMKSVGGLTPARRLTGRCHLARFAAPSAPQTQKAAVSPGRDSGLLSAKEASVCGCIPISTRHGGIPTIVDHGITGFLVEEHDVAAMTEHLIALSTMPRGGHAWQARREMCREFELRSSVRSLELHYDEAISRHGSR